MRKKTVVVSRAYIRGRGWVSIGSAAGWYMASRAPMNAYGMPDWWYWALISIAVVSLVSGIITLCRAWFDTSADWTGES